MNTTAKRPGLRARLMVFLCLMNNIKLGAVWFLVSYTLQPQYNRYIRSQLDTQLELVATLIDQAAEEGVVISSRASGHLMLNSDFWAELYVACGNALSGTCVDISDRSYHYVNYSEDLHPCLLHGQTGSNFLGGEVTTQKPDSSVMIALRQRVFVEGNYYGILSSSETSAQQMVLGRTAGNGEYCVIVSMSLAQIEDAGTVLRSMLGPIALVLLALDLLAGWLFASWYTKPLHVLSAAARQMAGGNYNVHVDPHGNDELGGLATDFNHMAQEVKRSTELQRDLLANVSHDLRTPLTLIKGYAETVRDLTGDNAERRTGQLNIIIDETDRLSALVNSVMELSKVQSGAEKPARVTFDMRQLCEEVAERYEAVCAQNGLQLRLELADAPMPVHADPAMMERVLHNLLGNAMNHIGQDGVFVLRAQPTATGVQVEVEDHGPGIPSEELPFLFDRYYRSRSDSGKPGTGLGLSIAKAIFQQHGFRFGVSSALGKGTTFWFTMSAPPQSRLGSDQA